MTDFENQKYDITKVIKYLNATKSDLIAMKSELETKEELLSINSKIIQINAQNLRVIQEVQSFHDHRH